MRCSCLRILYPTRFFSPDDYYNPKFHFCEPEGGPRSEPESLGSILFGDRIFNSPYEVSYYDVISSVRLKKFRLFAVD